MTFITLKYRIATKFRAHKCIFTALGKIVLETLGHLPVSQKVRGNAEPSYTDEG